MANNDDDQARSHDRAAAIFEAMVSFTKTKEELGLTWAEMLEAVEFCWLSVASIIRNEQLALPDAYPAERERQAATLERYAALVRSDTPDLEAERLWQQGLHAEAFEHLKRMANDSGSPDQSA